MRLGVEGEWDFVLRCAVWFGLCRVPPCRVAVVALTGVVLIAVLRNWRKWRGYPLSPVIPPSLIWSERESVGRGQLAWQAYSLNPDVGILPGVVMLVSETAETKSTPLSLDSFIIFVRWDGTQSIQLELCL